MEDNYIYNLKKNFKYSKKGDFLETGSIEFTPPDMDCFNESSDFEQIIMGSIVSAGKSSDIKPDDEEEKTIKDMKPPTASEIRMMLYVSQEIKVVDVANAFKRLAIKTAKFDETTKLKNDHFNKLSKDDFMDMMCGYASFFTFPSLLRGE